MSALGNLLIDHEALLEATRVRLSAEAYEALRFHVEAGRALMDQSDQHEVLVSYALLLLLDMYDKLEAIRHGHA